MAPRGGRRASDPAVHRLDNRRPTRPWRRFPIRVNRRRAGGWRHLSWRRWWRRGSSCSTATTASCSTSCSTSASSAPGRSRTATTPDGRRGVGARACGVLLSPGPGRPEEAGIPCAAIVAFAAAGRRCSACASATRRSGTCTAPRSSRGALMHGKTSEITHGGVGVFAGLPNPLTATRYHSLTLAPETVPADLEVTAGVRRHGDGHAPQTPLVEGVQFHPECFLTAAGHDLLGNFLGRCTPQRRLALRLGPQNRRSGRGRSQTRFWTRTAPDPGLYAPRSRNGSERAQMAGGTEVEGASARPDPPRRPPAPFKSKQPCSRAGQDATRPMAGR